jgi:hypothetical protein
MCHKLNRDVQFVVCVWYVDATKPLGTVNSIVVPRCVGTHFVTKCVPTPKYFVGHVWDIERCNFRYKDHERLDHMHMYYGGFSFEANAMLEVLESLP